MADLLPKERLQPSLLDRLTDKAPHKRDESREQRVMSVGQLKQSVMRDLKWLLNASRLESVLPLDQLPHLRGSVLNYGLLDLTGKTASSIDPTVVERAVRQSILDFEPRIIPSSLRVRMIDKEASKYNNIVFEITGEIWFQPMSEPLYLKTTLDLELGNVEIDLQG